MNRLNSAIAARQGIRQGEALLQADAAGAQADAVIRRVWRTLLAAVEARDFHAVAATWRTVGAQVADVLHKRFTRLAKWSHHSAVSALTQSLPRTYLAAIPLPVREDVTVEPAFAWEELLALIFPPPSQDDVTRIVFGTDWVRRLDALSRLAPAESLGVIVSQGYAGGKTQRELAKDLLPIVQGMQVSARRVARNEGMRIAHTVQMEAHEQLGDLLIGYQIHALLDQHTRPAHAARNGTIYYRQPKPGQLGFDRMPRPPQEADGTVAPNCRCWPAPVLAPPSNLAPKTRALFANNADAVIPHPAVYSEWFAQADEKRRTLAVGVRRYREMKRRLGAEPEWEAFLNPRTGELLPLDKLRGESPAQRDRRTAQAKALVQERGAALRQVLTFGTL